MQVQVEELAPCRVALHVEVEADRVEEIQQKAFKEVAPYVDVPGFRRGKAPKNLVERYMNQAFLRQHTLRLLVPTALDEAVKEAGLEVFDEPEIEEEPVLNPGEPVKFTAEFSTPPKIELGAYTGLQIEYPSLEIRDEDIDQSIAQLREQRAALQAVERPAETGDFVTIDYVAHVVGEEDSEGPMLRVAGSSENPLDQAILGHTAGETINVEAPLHTDEEKQASYDITLKEVRNWVVPDLDDTFAQSIGFDTVDALREDVRGRLQQQAKTLVEDDIEQKLVNIVRENATLSYPEILVVQRAADRMDSLLRELNQRQIPLDDYLTHEKTSLQQLEQDILDSSRSFVESQLVLTELIKAAELKLTEAEIAEEMGKESESGEPMERSAEDAANRVMYRKVIDYLKENNELVPVGAPSEESAAAPAEEKRGGLSSLFRRKPKESAAEETSSEDSSPDEAATDEEAGA